MNYRNMFKNKEHHGGGEREAFESLLTCGHTASYEASLEQENLPQTLG
jgi:hypothetical protein